MWKSIMTSFELDPKSAFPLNSHNPFITSTCEHVLMEGCQYEPLPQSLSSPYYLFTSHTVLETAQQLREIPQGFHGPKPTLSHQSGKYFREETPGCQPCQVNSRTKLSPATALLNKDVYPLACLWASVDKAKEALCLQKVPATRDTIQTCGSNSAPSRILKV